MSYFFQHFTSRQQGHAGSKTLHQQNPPVLNCMCLLTGVDLYNGRKTVVSWCYIYDNNESARCCVSHIQKECVGIFERPLFVTLLKIGPQPNDTSYPKIFVPRVWYTTLQLFWNKVNYLCCACMALRMRVYFICKICSNNIWHNFGICSYQGHCGLALVNLMFFCLQHPSNLVDKTVMWITQ